MDRRMVILPDGQQVPCLGQGTWHMGEDAGSLERETESLRLGISLHMTLIDTAEMYGDGASERLVGQAVAGMERSSLFLVSKVYPWNAGAKNIFASCENSLNRMGTDYLDLYLLHWPGSIPLQETVSCMEELKQMGKIRRWGVSNFDTADMEKLWAVPGGDKCAANQVLYHHGSRGIEYDLMPWLLERGIPVMAYCPVAQAGALQRQMLADKTLNEVARAHNVSVFQIMLAFVLRHTQVIAIPKAAQSTHTRENAQAANLVLSEAEWEAIERAFPAPAHKVPLDIQ